MELVYIITGTTRGLGKEIKDLLLSKGKGVISINRAEADLSKPEILLPFLNDFDKKLQSEYEDCDLIFINNAATLGQISPAENISALDIFNVIGTNFTSPLLFCNFLFSLDRNWKYFNITSGAAKSKNKYLGLYSVTKLALEKYLEFMDLETEGTNCKGIYNYDPKIIATSMNYQLQKNNFLKNKKLEETEPRDAKVAAKEFCGFIEKKLT